MKTLRYQRIKSRTSIIDIMNVYRSQHVVMASWVVEVLPEHNMHKRGELDP